MPLYLLTGRDVHLGQPQKVAIEADTPEAATRFALSRGIAAESVEVVSDGTHQNLPERVTLMRVPAPTRASAFPASILRRRLMLIGIGLGLGGLMIVGTLFVLKAREHLLRQEMTPPPDSSISKPSKP